MSGLQIAGIVLAAGGQLGELALLGYLARGEAKAERRAILAEDAEHRAQAKLALIREHVEHAYPGRYSQEPVDVAVKLALGMGAQR